MTITEKIQAHYHSLTKKQKEIADYLLENPADICYISIAGLCERTNCAPVTMLKFCKAVGFPSFIALKKEFRNYNQTLINQYSVSSYDVPLEASGNTSQTNYLETLCQEELQRISQFYRQLDLTHLEQIAHAIAIRDIIYIFAHDASKTMALFLKNRLDILNRNVVLVDLSDMKTVEYVIGQITPGDIAVIFSFPNYYYSVASVAGHIRTKGCSLVLLANSPDCPAVPYADYTIFCETRTKIFHNSWILPMAVLNLLTSTLAIVTEERSDTGIH